MARRICTVVFCAFVVAFLAGFVTAGASLAQSPLGTFPNCANGATPMAAQVWDITPGQPPEHIHTETCFPMLRSLSSPLALDVQTLAHDNDGTMNFLRWQDGSNTAQTLNINWTPGVSLAATRVDTLTLDPSKFAHSGWQETRMSSNFNDPVKGRWYTTARYPVLINNGKSVSNYAWDGKGFGRCGWAGWYGDYMNVYVACPAYMKAVQGGTFRPGETIQIKGDKPRLVATLDPDFHHGNPGRVIYDGASGTRTITLPADLAPGPHTLHIRTEMTRTSAPVGTFAGAGVMRITVAP